jgi:hypothetical protein
MVLQDIQQWLVEKSGRQRSGSSGLHGLIERAHATCNGSLLLIDSKNNARSISADSAVAADSGRENSRKTNFSLDKPHD